MPNLVRIALQKHDFIDIFICSLLSYSSCIIVAIVFCNEFELTFLRQHCLVFHVYLN